MLDVLAQEFKEPAHAHGQTNIVSSALRGVGRLVKTAANEVVRLGTNVTKAGYEFGRNTIGAGVHTGREAAFRLAVPRHGTFPSTYEYKGKGTPPASIGGTGQSGQQGNQKAAQQEAVATTPAPSASSR